MKASTIGLFVMVLLTVAACATQPAPAAPALPGFLLGFIHGFTAIFALVGSLFLHVRIYAFPNDGFWYDFGFIAGFCASLLALFLASIARIGGLIS